MTHVVEPEFSRIRTRSKVNITYNDLRFLGCRRDTRLCDMRTLYDNGIVPGGGTRWCNNIAEALLTIITFLAKYDDNKGHPPSYYCGLGTEWRSRVTFQIMPFRPRGSCPEIVWL